MGLDIPDLSRCNEYRNAKFLVYVSQLAISISSPMASSPRLRSLNIINAVTYSYNGHINIAAIIADAYLYIDSDSLS